MHINEFFEVIFCINLERRPDRRKQAEEEFAKHGIKVEFIPAIDAKANLEVPEFYGSDNEKGHPGDIGCVMSHLGIAIVAAEKGLRNYCVFEDDVELAVNFNELFANYIGQVPDNWDLLYFGGNHDIPPGRFSENIVRLLRTFTTHAYGVNSQAFTQIKEVLISAAFVKLDKVDLAISSLHSKLYAYCFHPRVAFQRAGFSDILEKEQEYRHLRNYQYVPLGLRCSAATIISEYFGRKMSLALDWVDLPLAALLDILSNLMSIGAEAYGKKFIAEVEIATQRHYNGTWLPHDINLTPGLDWTDVKNNVTLQYVRRFKRLTDLFGSGDNIVFLTVIPHDLQADMPTYTRIMQLLKQVVKGRCVFVTVNLLPYDNAQTDENHNLHANIVVPFAGEWAVWEADIAKRLKGFEHTNRYFL